MVLGVVGALACFWGSSVHSLGIRFLPRLPSAEWVLYPAPASGGSRMAWDFPTVFRCSFVLSTEPQGATLRAAGFRRYQMTVNGTTLQPPQSEGQNWKKPAAFAVSKLLCVGTNRIEVTVFNSNAPPALWLSLEGDGFRLASDENWICSYAGAAWLPARLASQPPPRIKDTPMEWGETPLEGFRAQWRLLLLFTVLVAAVCSLGPRLAKRFTPGLKMSPGYSESLAVLLPVAAAAVLWAALFANNLSALPVNAGYDRSGHVAYIRYIQSQHALPLANEGWEAFQPPLYYLVSAIVLGICRLSASSEAGIMVLRLVGFAIGLAEITFIWASLRLLFPGARGKQLSGFLFAAFLPPVLFLSQYVTNELLAGTLVTACLYQALRLMNLERGGSWGAYLGLGLCLGAALLTKASALLALPAVAGGLVWKALSVGSPGSVQGAGPPEPKGGGEEIGVGDRRWHQLRSLAPRLALMFAVCLAVAGWHYIRAWRHFGTPLVGVWDPRTGFPWWQDRGYQTREFYLGFGHVLSHPWYASLESFPGGLYATLWGDGQFGGASALADRPPWNYELMAAGYWLALPLTLFILAGGVSALIGFLRRPTPQWFMLLSLLFLAAAALVQFSLSVPYYCNVKAFYGMAALLPCCALVSLGFESLAARSSRIRFGLWAGLGVWAITSYASVWVLRDAAPATVGRAKFLASAGRKAEEVKLLKTLLRHYPDDLNGQTIAAYLLKNEADGARLAAELEHENPNHAEAQLFLARLCAQQNRIGEAVEHGRRALEAAPASTEVYEFLASLLLDAGRYKDAGEVARRGLATDPLSADLRLAVGALCLIQGRSEEAESQLKLAFRLKPNWSQAHAVLAALFSRLNRPEEAAAEYTEAVRQEPKNAAWCYQLGNLLVLLGRAQDATQYLTRTLELEPANSKAHSVLAAALTFQGRDREAVAHYREALRLEPQSAAALDGLAWLRATEPDPALRDGAEAVRLAEQARQLAGTNIPVVWKTLAAAYAEAGRFDDAKLAAQRACDFFRAQGTNSAPAEYQQILDRVAARKPYRAAGGHTTRRGQ